MHDGESLDELSRLLVAEMIAARRTFAAAESCTGGWIAKAVTDVPGASMCFSYGLVSYSNGAKESLLGVSPKTLENFGAVSEKTVTEMADGALRLSGADFAVAVSGIAGPGGGTASKPVGTVCFCWAATRAGQWQMRTARHCFDGDRREVRAQSVAVALQGLREMLVEIGSGPQ
jgi:nicotinamide-nucleotide amidase